MIWVRRTLAVLLALLFLPLFLGAVAALRLNATALDPGFWVATLRKAEVYTFVHDDLLPAALEEALPDDSEDAPIDLAPLQGDILSVVRETLPPEWLQERTEEALQEVYPYLLGDVDSFSLTVPLEDRVVAAAGAVKRVLREGEAFPSLYDGGVGWAAEQAVSENPRLPEGISFTAEEVEGYLRRLIPMEWLREQAPPIIDELEPYVTGSADGFQINLTFADRVDELSAILKEVIGRPEVYDLVVDQVVDRGTEVIVGGLEEGIGPGGSVSREEVREAFQEVLTRDWVLAHQAKVSDAVVDYLTGREQNITVAVELESRKEAAFDVLGPHLERAFREEFEALPLCSPEEMAALGSGNERVPSCRPPGVSYTDWKEVVGLETGAELARDLLAAGIPNEWTFTESDLRAALGPQGEETLDRVRRWVQDGFTLTEADLLGRLDAEQVETIDEVRARIRDGITVTQDDLRELVADTGGEEALASFDRARSLLGTARRLSFLAWLGIGLVLAAVGFLAGRTWGSRLAWAAVPLGIGSLLLLAAAAPLYSGVARPQLEAITAQATADATGVARIAAERGALVVLLAADEFAAGLRRQALLLLALAGSGLAAGILLQVLVRRPPPPSSVPEEEPSRPTGL